MTTYCALCKKKHEDWAWKYMSFKDESGTKKSGWFCRKAFEPSPDPERVPDRIRNARFEHWNSVVQPFRNGEPSREFLEAHPDKAKKMFTSQQIKTMKYTWKDVPGWANRAKSK